MIRHLRQHEAACDAGECTARLVFAERIGTVPDKEFWEAGWRRAKTKMNTHGYFVMWDLCPKCAERAGLPPQDAQRAHYFDGECPEWLGIGQQAIYDC